MNCQSTPVYEERSCEETTVVFNENGSVSKRRRRKSLGRRVSFAEAPPSLHIFPRDDDYETPTRTTNGGGGSPHGVGERRSPRLAAKVVDADKENRGLTPNSGSRRRRGGSKPLSARGGESSALKPQNWLDVRNSPSQAGGDEENTGPVDLRHLSFDQKESEEDDENLTLDSTTFALKFSLPRDRNDEPVVVHLDKNSSELSTVEAFPDDVLEKDMSFTINRRHLQRKSATESQTGFGDTNSDMSLTVQVKARERKPCILSGESDGEDEDLMVLSNQRIPSTGKPFLPGSRDDNSALVVYSHNVQNSPSLVPSSVDVRATLDERYGTDMSNAENNVPAGREEKVDATGLVDMSLSPQPVCSTTGHEGHREEEDEGMTDNDRTLSLAEGSPSDMPEISLTGIEILEGRETNNLQTNAHGVEDMIVRGTQENKLTHTSPEHANTMATGVVPTRMPGGEESDSSLGNADDVDVCPTDKVYAGIEKANFTSLPQDVELRAAAVDITLQEAQESQRTPLVVNNRLTVAVLEGTQNSDEWDNSATINSEESPGQRFGNRATKRTKFVRDLSFVDGKDSEDVNSSHKNGYVGVDRGWAAQDNDSSSIIEGVTAQVPRFSDLLAADVNSVNSTPVRPVSRSMWMTPPSTVIAARAYAKNSNPERDNGDDEYLTSPTDTSMEIVDPTVHSLSASPIGATEESPKICDGQVPDIFATGETKICDENRSTQDISCTRDTPRLLSIPHENEVAPNSLSKRTQRQECHDQQDDLATKERVDPTQIFSSAQPNESKDGNQRVPSQYLESEEMGRHENLLFDKGTVDCTQILSSSLEQAQSMNPSSPRPRQLEQVLKAIDPEMGFHNLEVNNIHKFEVSSKLSDDISPRLQDRIQAVEGESVTKMSVDEFFQRLEVQFSNDLPSPGELMKDPSLAATHHVRTLSECFHFLCLVKPKLTVMRDSCGVLEDEIDIKATTVAELERQLTANNPAIFSFFQNAPEWKKQRIKKQLESALSKYRLLAEKNRLHFQQIVEMENKSIFLEKKEMVKYCMQSVHEQRNMFDEKCCRPLVCLQAKLSGDTNLECTSFPPKGSNVEVDPRSEVDLGRIEDLKERLKYLASSEDLKLAKLRLKQQAAEDALRRLKQSLELTQKKLSDSRSQVADKMCFGKNHLQREEVAHSPYLYVQRMKGEACLLDMLQDGFQVKTVQENQDLVVELGYRSIVKRRYVVRKAGVAVKVLASSWTLDAAKIEEVFPGVNASVIFSLALTTTKYGGISKTSAFGRLSALEAVRFTLPSIKTVGIPGPTNLRASMQVTRILLGNLTEFIKEVGKCQVVVNDSSGGGVLGEPRFRNAPDDGKLQLELTFIDCVSSIKFFVILDMSCLALNGYPLGDLTAEVKVDYCAPLRRERFKAEILEDTISQVKPGYKRLVRTYEAVGTFLASLRREV